MIATRDVVTGHVPEALVYGPVESRRFGRSLGVSCDQPGIIGCRWHCPYCQLGAHPPDPTAAYPSAGRILQDLAHHLAAGPACDAICIAGNGEPTDHPDFAAIAAEVASQARLYALRSILLTNGDGLALSAKRATAAVLDEVWVKIDPGPPLGAWRRDPGDRRALLDSLGPLRVQALVYAGPGSSAGTAGTATRTAWLDLLAALDVVEVHLTTISRPPARRDLRPVTPAVLLDWRHAAEDRLGCAVRCFGRDA